MWTDGLIELISEVNGGTGDCRREQRLMGRVSNSRQLPPNLESNRNKYVFVCCCLCLTMCHSLSVQGLQTNYCFSGRVDAIVMFARVQHSFLVSLLSKCEHNLRPFNLFFFLNVGFFFFFFPFSVFQNYHIYCSI